MAPLHGELRTLETDAERLLLQYSALAKAPVPDSTVPEELTRNFAARTSLLDDFAIECESHNTPALKRQLARHYEVLDDHRATSRRLAEQLVQERNRRTLLADVRSDIRSHREGALARGDADAYLMDERGRIDQSHSVADRLLQEAYETRADFMHQQQMLAGIQRRIWHVASRVPGINTLLSRIGNRQKKNSLILAAVITTCIVLLFFLR